MLQGGIRFVYDDWNEAHPDKQIDYTLNTEFSYADLFASIRSGDYDWAADLIPVFELQSEDTVGRSGDFRSGISGPHLPDCDTV